jgi:hypothetical protein
LKILFISNDGFSNNTSSVIQNKGIVQGLHNLGNIVDVLTLEPEKNMVIYDESMNNMDSYINCTYYIPLNTIYKKLASHQRTFVENTKKENRIKSFIKGKIRRLIKSILIYDIRVLNVSSLSNIDIDLNRYDIIISASDPKSSHYLACKLLYKKKYKGRYIQYWGDPLFLDITRQHTFLDIIYKKNESNLIRNASKIMYATPFTLQEQKKLYPTYSYKMDYIYQVPPYESEIMTAKKHALKNKFEIVYCGDYRSTTRNIKPLYKAIFSNEQRLHLTVCGTSDLFLISNENVSVLGAVNHQKANRVENSADILICICNLKGSQIPGKIYYLCKYKKPIIIILDGNYAKQMASYFTKFNRFILCDNNSESIKKAILESKDCNKENIKESPMLKPEYIAKKIIEEI